MIANVVNRVNSLPLDFLDFSVYYAVQGGPGGGLLYSPTVFGGDVMSATAVGGATVGKKKAEGKGEGPPRRYGTLIRVSDEFAEAIGRAASFEGKSVAEYATAHLLPVVEKRYRDAMIKEARRMGGQGE